MTPDSGHPLQAQLVPTLAHVTQDPLRAGMLQYLVGGVSGDALRAGVPEGDPPVTVDEVDPVLHLLEDGAVDLFAHAALLSHVLNRVRPRSPRSRSARDS